MLSRRLLLLCVVCASVASTLRGEWEDRFMGLPMVEVYPSSVTQAPGFFLSMVQDEESKNLYAGTFGAVLAFDGNTWRTLDQGPSIEYRSLAIDPKNSRLWFGSTEDLGYFELSQSGREKYVSLRSRLPFPATELGNIAACQAGAHGVDFVARDRVLRWDGEKFTVWRFPTRARLFPVKFEGALWIHHQDSGLYRLGPAGPTEIAPPAELPQTGIFHLQRSEGLLLTISNQGIRSIEMNPRLLSPPETNDFLDKGKVVCVTSLPNNRTLISTLQSGSAIMDSNWRILKIIDETSGYSAQSFGHFVDRDQNCWIFDGQSVTRIQAPGSIAEVFSKTHTPQNFIDSIAIENDSSVWIGSNQTLFHAQPGAALGQGISLTPQAVEKQHIRCAVNTPHGLILGGQRDLKLVRGNQESTIATLPSADFITIVPSRREQDRYLTLAGLYLAELLRKADGSWELVRHENVAAASANATSMAEDEQGGVWLGSTSHGPSYLRRNENGEFTEVALPASLSGKWSVVYRRPNDILIAVDQSLYRVESGRDPQQLYSQLPARSWLGAISHDGLRLYFIQHHIAAPPAFSKTVLVVEFTPDGTVLGQRSLIIPNLHSIGDLRTMHVTSERGSDTLWLGGSIGLLQARVSELPAWQPPQPPTLELVSENQLSTRSVFPAQHLLKFDVRPQEFTLRPAIRFQTRLGNDQPWSESSDLTHFEFSNLREGTYAFYARTVNPIGQTSEAVAYTFAIQPPWYQSKVAYVGYFALMALGTLATMRYREGRIQARAELLEKTVAERTAELVKANAAKDEFLASMSHEIRNPMNGVVGLSAAIDTSHLNHEGRHRFDLLRHCAAHLASLLEDILDFSKLQAGTVEIDPQPFAMTELLDAVAAITSAASAEAESPLELALGPTVPPRLIGDARRIRQILLNYVTNALKYAPHSQVDLTVWARPAQENSVRVTFAVTDQGPGIPASEHERIFEKFERGVGARLNRIPGTGMGLAVCRKLAVAMGGRAWCESTPGEGSTFFLELTLPLATNAPIVSSSPDILDRAPRLALVVDDEEYNLIALSSHLSGLGYEVTPAADAATAIKQVSAQDFHSIFLDYEMPELKGPQLARHIRQICAANGRQPLIFATTAYTTADKRAECLAAGMDGFLGKPVEPGKLRRLLAEHVEQNPATPPEATPEIVVVDPLDNLRRMARQKSTTLSAEFSEFCAATAAEFAEFDAGQLARDSARCARSAHRLTGRLGFVTAQNAAVTAHTLQNVCQAGDWISAAHLRADTERLWRIHHDTLNRLTSTPSA